MIDKKTLRTASLEERKYIKGSMFKSDEGKRRETRMRGKIGRKENRKKEGRDERTTSIGYSVYNMCWLSTLELAVVSCIVVVRDKHCS